MSTPTGANPELVCALRLLFDGKDPKEVADALAEACDAQSLFWAMSDRTYYATMYVVDAETVAGYLDGEDYVFTGTKEQLMTALKDLQNGGGSDFANDAMYDLCRDEMIGYLKNNDFIREMTDEEKNTPAPNDWIRELR